MGTRSVNLTQTDLCDGTRGGGFPGELPAQPQVGLPTSALSKLQDAGSSRLARGGGTPFHRASISPGHTGITEQLVSSWAS